jgi:hypothetical protein
VVVCLASRTWKNGRMSAFSEDRVGRNEDVFRKINERIEAGKLPADIEEPVAFCCECALLGCNELIEISIATYETIRANPRRFLLLQGHMIPGVETVIATGDLYVIVEKTGEAGRVAEAADPRAI